MATKLLFWAVTQPGWNKRVQLSSPSTARSPASLTPGSSPSMAPLFMAGSSAATAGAACLSP